MALSQRLDHFQRRHPVAGFPIAVVYKFFDDSGSYLAALIAYYGVVSVFPLLLLSSTILGFLLAHHPGLQQDLLNSAAHQIPVIGSQLEQPKGIGGGAIGIVVGVLGALYGGLGVAQAAQHALNTAWRVPRNERPNPFHARGRSLVMLAVVGLSVVATTGLSALGTAGPDSFGTAAKVGVTVASVLVNVVVFVFVFRYGTARPLSIRDVAPGAALAAVAWQALQSFGVAYVSHVVAKANEANGVFALVLGTLAFLYLAATVVVFAVEVNVVRVDRLHPRALLTPFTDSAPLTAADRRAYADAAEAQRTKGFEDIDVRFDQGPRS